MQALPSYKSFCGAVQTPYKALLCKAFAQALYKLWIAKLCCPKRHTKLCFVRLASALQSKALYGLQNVVLPPSASSFAAFGEKFLEAQPCFNLGLNKALQANSALGSMLLRLAGGLYNYAFVNANFRRNVILVSNL
ncbi:hypothetical protein EON70_00905 [bacterium]|nr:MAG: hypothetical protein EON70_00905 [bacterium]